MGITSSLFSRFTKAAADTRSERERAADTVRAAEVAYQKNQNDVTWTALVVAKEALDKLDVVLRGRERDERAEAERVATEQRARKLRELDELCAIAAGLPTACADHVRRAEKLEDELRAIDKSLMSELTKQIEASHRARALATELGVDAVIQSPSHRGSLQFMVKEALRRKAQREGHQMGALSEWFER